MEDTQVNEEFWCNFDKILNETFVPHISDEIIRPCAKEDFQEFKKTLIENFHTIIKLLNIIKNEEHCNKRHKSILLKVLVIIGEQHVKTVWNSNEIVKFSKLLTFQICKIFKIKNITEIFKEDDIFLMFIRFLRPKLLKETWKSFPASVVCYQWLLELVEKPLLKRYIPEILPTALIISDDYVLENKILGLKCINLIIDHCYKSKTLKSFNYDEVIFEALLKMVHKVEYNMITSVYLCISNLLENIEYCDNINTFTWTKRDEILVILLDNMELQTNPQCRYAYIISIPRFLTQNISGKWSKRLTRILSEYCENYIDLDTTKAVLDFIKTFISMYQPRGSNFYTNIYGSLIKLRYKFILLKKDIKEIHKIDQCISLLNKFCPNVSKEILKNDIVKSIITSI